MKMKNIYRAKDLAEFFKVSESSIWRWSANGTIPKPLKISRRVSVWDLYEVIDHIEKKQTRKERKENE